MRCTGIMHVLTNNTNCEGNVWSSMRQINKSPDRWYLCRSTGVPASATSRWFYSIGVVAGRHPNMPVSVRRSRTYFLSLILILENTCTLSLRGAGMSLANKARESESATKTERPIQSIARVRPRKRRTWNAFFPNGGPTLKRLDSQNTSGLEWRATKAPVRNCKKRTDNYIRSETHFRGRRVM